MLAPGRWATRGRHAGRQVARHARRERVTTVARVHTDVGQTWGLQSSRIAEAVTGSARAGTQAHSHRLRSTTSPGTEVSPFLNEQFLSRSLPLLLSGSLHARPPLSRLVTAANIHRLHVHVVASRSLLDARSWGHIGTLFISYAGGAEVVRRRLVVGVLYCG